MKVLSIYANLATFYDAFWYRFINMILYHFDNKNIGIYFKLCNNFCVIEIRFYEMKGKYRID